MVSKKDVLLTVEEKQPKYNKELEAILRNFMKKLLYRLKGSSNLVWLVVEGLS